MKDPLIRVIEGGGSGFRFADVRDTEIGPVVYPTEKITSVEQLLAFIKHDSHLESVDAIAVSVAGVIRDQSLVEVSPNLHFLDRVNLGLQINLHTSKLAIVVNDMEASVTGMARLFPNLERFAGITWSSGIGMRIWNNGRILSDSEAGHVCIDSSPFAPLCGCGRRGCIEAIASGSAIERRVTSELAIRGIKMSAGVSPCVLLDVAYCAGESWALQIYQIVAISMGQFLANLQTTLHLPAIVWKGSFGLKVLRLRVMEGMIRSVMRSHLIHPAWEQDLKFYYVPQPPQLIQDGDAFIGAANLALSLFA